MHKPALPLSLGLGLLLVACQGTPQPDPGASAAQKAVVERGLAWLAAHQDDDGRWDADGFMKHDTGSGERCDGAGNPVHDVGVTGLAMLAFLGDGNTLRTGPYKDNLKKAVKWLRTQQGNNGLYGTAASHDFIYDHAIATYAMIEAYGLSEYKTLKKMAQGGLNYLEAHRNPYKTWRYQPRDGDNDTSVTLWCAMAYRAGKDFDLQVNDNALKMTLAYLDSVTDQKTGHAGYTKRGETSSRHPGDHGTRFPVDRCETLTAGALLLRHFLGDAPRRGQLMRAAADRVAKKLPEWSPQKGTIDHLYWYYGTFALYQAGGENWKAWKQKLVDQVFRHQRKDGNFKGSWDPMGVWGEDGGRVYSTALLTLIAEVDYRYAKLVR